MGQHERAGNLTEIESNGDGWGGQRHCIGHFY
jgi:hypothetical protein